MAGYLLLERRFLQPHKPDGVRPNTLRLGFLGNEYYIVGFNLT